METKQLKGNGGILIERTETPRGIIIPDLTETLTFGLPIVGPDYFNAVMEEIDKEGLRPTTRQTILLVDVILKNAEEEHFKDLLAKFKNNYFWTSTERLSFKDGSFVYNNADGKMPSSSGELAKLCVVKDQRVRFVEKGLRQGLMPISEFLKHPEVIAQAGEDMIDTLGRIAEKCHEKEAYVGYLDSADSDTKRYTALCSGRNGGWLGIVGDCDDDGSGGGYASLVRKASTEGASTRDQEK